MSFFFIFFLSVVHIDFIYIMFDHSKTYQITFFCAPSALSYNILFTRIKKQQVNLPVLFYFFSLEIQNKMQLLFFFFQRFVSIHEYKYCLLVFIIIIFSKLGVVNPKKMYNFFFFCFVTCCFHLID